MDWGMENDSTPPPQKKNMMDVWCDLIEQKKKTPQTNKKIHARI